MREIDACRAFAHLPGIIHMVDHAVARERGAGGGVSGVGTMPGGEGQGGGGGGGGADGESTHTVYVVLPYYSRGNLQDMINANLVNHARFPERRLMVLFLGLCKALRGMHRYRPPTPGMQRMEVGDPEQGVLLGAPRGKSARAGGGRKARTRATRAPRQRHGGPEYGDVGSASDSEGDDAADAAAALHDDPLSDGDDDDKRPLHAPDASSTIGSPGIKSYAHRDIKPANVIVADSGTQPILMDLGSVAACPLPITSHSLAIATQDTAAEHSTMPYRAPELFDVRTGTVIDTAVDIWSLGCTLFACLVGKSPFEMRSDETGGSLSICVLGGDWRFPDEGAPGQTAAAIRRTNTGGAGKGKQPEGASAARGAGGGPSREAGISESIREVVRRCLRVEPAERPDIDELIELVEGVIEELPDDDE
jgi:serine/threonine kinase 16